MIIINKYGYSRVKEGLYQKNLVTEKERIVFLMNAGDFAQTVKPERHAEKLCGALVKEGEYLTIPAKSFGYFIEKRV